LEDPGELGQSNAVHYDTFPFNAVLLLVWWQKGHLACKKLGIDLLVVTMWHACHISHHHITHP